MEENNSNSSYKMVNFSKKEKNDMGIKRTVVVPFLSGVIGTCLVLSVCFGIPSIKEQLLGNNSTNTIPTIQATSSAITTSNTTSLANYSDVGSYAANKILPSIVGITVEYSVNSIFGSKSAAEATGSGIILTQDGYIVTNNHVINTSSGSSNAFYQVSDANKITVKLYNDSTEYEAKVIGTDKLTDVAVIKIEKTGLTPAELGNSDELKIGEFALVAGNPLGFDFSVTSGSISAINREITDDEGVKYSLIQTDAAINSGNSGGALVNAEGKVVGITFMKIASTEVEGICFALPITPNIDIINQLIEFNKVKRPYIGIGGTDIDANTAKRYNLAEGVYIQQIDPLSSAGTSGLQVRDVIIEIDGKKIQTMSDVDEYKFSKNIGDKIKIKVNRNGETLEFEVELIEQP